MKNVYKYRFCFFKFVLNTFFLFVLIIFLSNQMDLDVLNPILSELLCYCGCEYKTISIYYKKKITWKNMSIRIYNINGLHITKKNEETTHLN